jgi:hypothetical protein
MFAPGHVYFVKGSKNWTIVLYVKATYPKPINNVNFAVSMVFFGGVKNKLYTHYTDWSTYTTYGKLI